MSYTDVAQVSNAARNYEILHERDNDDTERPDKRHPGECRRAAGTCFKCGQAGHLQKDCKKNTTASTSGRLIRSQVHRVVFSPSLKVMLLIPQNTVQQLTVVHIELSLVTFMHLSLFIMVPYRENLCRSF
nr:hypothetical protein [Tanacetum cinerariifolium]